jgi:ribonuclease BN (tRNA processing enzyme)
VIDCGDGVARQLILAGIALPSIRSVFVTHHHSDHNADYGNLLLLAWTAGLAARVDTWGPPPLARITELLFGANEYDISTRVADEGRIPIQPLVHPHELTQGDVLTLDDGLK